MLLLGPPIFLYCKIFGVGLTRTIINKITGIFLGGGTEVTKNVADAVIDKTPEITEIAIDKGQEIAEKIINTASSKIIENPKTIAKILGAWVGLSVTKEILVQTISKVGDQLGEKISEEIIVPVVITSFSLITSPWCLLVIIPAFAAHIYYQH
ncbi:hypothetical protein KAT08_03540 [Candidatus Babeliales bacterium]|nr:hypothetical protein [Candidatus Babeliales bacterium]